MASVEVTDDYYAILEVHQTASISDIKKSYHRLAILRHPDKNQNKPDATASFQLLNRAYETLKDESLRRMYDIKWPQIIKTHRAAQKQAKRDAEAAKAASEKSAKEKATKDAKEQKSRLTLEALAKKKQVFASEVFEAKRAITRLQSELKNIQTLEEKALAEEWARNSRFTYGYSPLFDAPKELEEAKQEREMQRLHRLANKTIKAKELSRRQEKLKEWNDLLSSVEQAIAAEISKSQERAKRAEREKEEAWQQEEAKAYKKRQEEYMEHERANRAAAEARAAQERAAVEAFRRAAEERRKKKEEEEEEEETRKLIAEMLRERGEEEEEEEAMRQEEAKEAEEQLVELLRNMNLSTASEAPTGQGRFLFQCPVCQMRAGAGCWGASGRSGGWGPGPSVYCRSGGGYNAVGGFGTRGEFSAGGGFSPWGVFSPRGWFSTGGGFSPGGGFSTGGGFSPRRGFSPGVGFSTGGGFSPRRGFSPGVGFSTGGGFSPGEGFNSGYCDDEYFTYDW